MRRHAFEPCGGMKENPGVWDNGHGGLIYIDKCACGVTRKRGKDYTNARPSNNWGPQYFNPKGVRLEKAGPCFRDDRDDELRKHHKYIGDVVNQLKKERY